MPTQMADEQPYTQAEVDTMVEFFGRKIDLLNAALEESDQLARAGERVGYESAYRVLRRVVVQVLDTPPPALRRPVADVKRQENPEALP